MKSVMLQPSGERMVLEVTPELTGWQLKNHIKEGQPLGARAVHEPRTCPGRWDQPIDSRRVPDDAKALEAGHTADVVSLSRTGSYAPTQRRVWAPSTQNCAGFAVEIPSDETRMGENACTAVAAHYSEVDHPRLGNPHWGIGEGAFCKLQLPGKLDHPNGQALWCLSALQFFGELDHPQVSNPH